MATGFYPIVALPSFCQIETQDQVLNSFQLTSVSISQSGAATSRPLNISQGAYASRFAQHQVFYIVDVEAYARNGFATEDDLQNIVNPAGTTNMIFTFNTPDASGATVNYGGLKYIAYGITFGINGSTLNQGSPLMIKYTFFATNVVSQN